jgi:hypothetical protein
LVTCVLDNISSDIDSHLNTHFREIRQYFEQVCFESDIPAGLAKKYSNVEQDRKIIYIP